MKVGKAIYLSIYLSISAYTIRVCCGPRFFLLECFFGTGAPALLHPFIFFRLMIVAAAGCLHPLEVRSATETPTSHPP